MRSFGALVVSLVLVYALVLSDAFRLQPVSRPGVALSQLQFQQFSKLYSEHVGFHAKSEQLIYKASPTDSWDMAEQHRPNVVQSAYHKLRNALRSLIELIKQWLHISPGPSHVQRDEIDDSSLSGSTEFLSLPSTPISRIANVNAGRQYAQARLQEIENYLSKGRGGVTQHGHGGHHHGRKYTAPEENGESAAKAMTKKRTVDDLTDDEIVGKRILVRCDLNVPLKDGSITDDTRIRSSLPTIQHLINKGAKVIVTSHLGRPKGEGYDAKYSLVPVAASLSTLLGKMVPLVPDCVGVSVQKAVAEMQAGDVVLLENVRFYGEEEANDAHFAAQLAASSGAEVYVNDAFGTAHRAHASTAGVASHVPVAVAGKLLQKELTYLSAAVNDPKRPFVAIVGGSKVSSKMFVLESLLNKVNTLVIGGGMLFTFLKARGVDVGASKVEDAQLELACRIETTAQTKGVKLVLARDVVVADRFAADAEHKVVPVDDIPEGWMGLDVGPQSIADLATTLQDAQTVLWNGPMGVFEFPAFALGTTAVARTLAELTKTKGCVTIVGGGDSVAAVEQAGLADHMSHISTGGGASLELLEGKVLPGIAALNDAK